MCRSTRWPISSSSTGTAIRSPNSSNRSRHKRTVASGPTVKRSPTVCAMGSAGATGFPSMPMTSRIRYGSSPMAPIKSPTMTRTRRSRASKSPINLRSSSISKHRTRHSSNASSPRPNSVASCPNTSSGRGRTSRARRTTPCRWASALFDIPRSSAPIVSRWNPIRTIFAGLQNSKRSSTNSSRTIIRRTPNCKRANSTCGPVSEASSRVAPRRCPMWR